MWENRAPRANRGFRAAQAERLCDPDQGTGMRPEGEGQMSHREYTYQDVAEAFVYEPGEGRLWRREPDESLREVSLAWESNERGFVNATACFRYRKITATHICFMLQMGRWPTLGMIIDHRDGNRRNNKWSNLREGTQQQNPHEPM